MTEVNPPYALQAAGISHPAILFRRAIQGMIEEGVTRFNGTSDLAVTQNSPVDMSILVDRGGAFVKGDDVQDQGMYFVYNDASKSLTVTAADATYARKDIVVARILDGTHGQVGDTWLLAIIAGTAAASPTEPATPATALRLATIDIAAGATSITNANITNRRVTAERPLLVRKNSTGTDYRRARLNLIEGASTTLTLVDDPDNDEIDVTVASAVTQQFVGAKAIRSTNLIVNSSTLTVVPWNGTDVYDTHNLHDSSTNPERMTIPTGYAGKWRFNSSVRWTNMGGAATVIVESRLYKNGALLAAGYYPIATASNVSGVIDCNDIAAVGDYYEIRVQHTTGTAETLVGGATESWFEATFLGA